jgi:hypothetical protein
MSNHSVPLGVQDRRITAVKSSNGRTIWEVIDGRLKESGGDSYKFTLTATDTLALSNLLHDNYDLIVDAARKEQRKMEGDARVDKASIPYR